MSHWVYSAIVVTILSAALGLLVSGLVIRRVYGGERPKPAVAMLLIVLLGLSFGQFIEQTRVLLFRASFDGHLDRGVFFALYNSTWNVTSSKLLLAASLSAAAALNLSLYCNRPERVTMRWTILGALGPLIAWVLLSMLLDVYI